MKEYNITFSEMMNLLLEGKCVQGKTFEQGRYMKLDKYGRIVLVIQRIEYEYSNIRALSTDKYRIVTVSTLNELTD